MISSNKRRPKILTLFLPALIAMLPLLALGGGLANPVQAGAPISSVASQEQREEVLVVRVYFRDNAERDRLAAELGAEEVPTTLGFLTVLTDRPSYNDFIAQGLRVEIDAEQSKVFNDPDLTATFYGGYKTVEEIYAFLDQKVAAHPTLAEKVDIGDSWCKENPGSCIRPEPNNGYDLFVMHITNRDIPGPKPVLWIDAGVHSREIATPEVALRYISWLLDNYSSNADAHWLVDWHDIWVMPTFNPDGHHIVEAGGNSPYLYRKNGNNTAGACAWPPTSSNHHGIDNNRNFVFKWGCCGGSTTSPCQQTYRGVSRGSEPETEAVMNKIAELIPDQNGPNGDDEAPPAAPITTTGVYQNIHTVVPVNLIPWGWTNSNSPNHAELTNIAAHLSALNALGNNTGDGGNTYPYGTIANQLYIVDGGSIDHVYGKLGAASISTELSGGSFLPSYTCIDNPGCGSTRGIWPENRGMLIHHAKIARTPYLLTHGPDTNLVATNPMTVTQGTPSDLTATINFAWTGNSFAQNVGAAEYYVDTPPWAGGTAIPMSGAFGGSQTVAVNAVIDTTSLAPGRHVIFVRGRGVNDYLGHQTWGPFTAAFLDVLGGGGGTPTATGTSVPSTGTATLVPATVTATRTGSPAPPTMTRTATAISGTATGTSVVTMTATRTATSAVTASTTTTPCSGRVTICHRTGNGNSHTITVSCSALPSHLAHGDTMGTCPEPTPRAGAGRFSDVNQTDFFYDFVLDLNDDGAITGYSDATFRPYNQATRGQFVKIAVLAFHIPLYDGEEQHFSDVPTNHTFYQYIETARRDNIIGGYSDGTFRPFANVTRGQVAKIAVESARMADLSTDIPTFSDVPVGHTFYSYIETAYANGILSGYSDGTFRSENDATRGQVAKIIDLATHPSPTR